MSFIFGGNKPSTQAFSPAPTPLAPINQSSFASPTGDASSQKEILTGGANRRRGTSTILSGSQTVLGATQGKSLLGA